MAHEGSNLRYSAKQAVTRMRGIHGAGDGGWRGTFPGLRFGGGERDVDIFKKFLSGDTADAGISFDEVVSRLAGMFAAEGVGECEGLG